MKYKIAVYRNGEEIHFIKAGALPDCPASVRILDWIVGMMDKLFNKPDPADYIAWDIVK